MAEVKLPNIIPIMSNEAMFLILGAMTRMSKMMIDEPINAEIAVPKLPLRKVNIPNVIPPIRE
jgi:hypothetical protein